MSLPSQSFSNVTPAQFAALAAKVQQQTGVVIAGNEGQASARGFTLSWNFDGASDLTVQVIDKPWIVPAGAVSSQIAQMVQEAQA